MRESKKVVIKNSINTISRPKSTIELLPPEILILILQQLPSPHRLLLALSSTTLWQIYLSTSPKFPSLWTEIIPHPTMRPIQQTTCPPPENYPYTPSTASHLPLGSLLQHWMAPRYRQIKFPARRANEGTRFRSRSKEELPPFFVRVSWKDSKYWFKQDERRLLNRYAIYHACYRYPGEESGPPTPSPTFSFLRRPRSRFSSSRSGNSTQNQAKNDTGQGEGNWRLYVLPHPRGKGGYTWYCEVNKAIEEDRRRWKTWTEWQEWWLHYHWEVLDGSAKAYAEELVRSGLGIVENESLG